MKRVILAAILTVFLLGGMISTFTATAQPASNAYLGQLEVRYFNNMYEKDKLTDRLARLEKLVFGEETRDLPNDQRLERLKSVLAKEKSPTPLTGLPQEAIPALTPPTPYNQDYSAAPQDQPTITEGQPSPFSVDTPMVPQEMDTYTERSSLEEEVSDYPIVSIMEEKVLKQTFRGEDITKRLSRLETDVFGTASKDLALIDRVDALKSKVLSNSDWNKIVRDDRQFSMNHNLAQQGFTGQGAYPQEYQELQPGEMPQQMEITDENMKEILTKLEKEAFDETFTYEPIHRRLDRLEMSVFKGTEPAKPAIERLERVATVIAADRTNNSDDWRRIRRMQKVRTGITIGGILFSILGGFLF